MKILFVLIVALYDVIKTMARPMMKGIWYPMTTTAVMTMLMVVMMNYSMTTRTLIEDLTWSVDGVDCYELWRIHCCNRPTSVVDQDTGWVHRIDSPSIQSGLPPNTNQPHPNTVVNNGCVGRGMSCWCNGEIIDRLIWPGSLSHTTPQSATIVAMKTTTQHSDVIYQTKAKGVLYTYWHSFIVLVFVYNDLTCIIVREATLGKGKANSPLFFRG